MWRPVQTVIDISNKYPLVQYTQQVLKSSHTGLTLQRCTKAGEDASQDEGGGKGRFTSHARYCCNPRGE